MFILFIEKSKLLSIRMDQLFVIASISSWNWNGVGGKLLLEFNNRLTANSQYLHQAL